MLDNDEGVGLESRRGSSALSEAADGAYPDAPLVRNEMLNRTHLTSQGAKARRLLIEAMIEKGEQANLGLEGYGPEVAMYKAALAHTQIHVRGKTAGKMEFRAPRAGRTPPDRISWLECLGTWTFSASRKRR